MSNMSYCRFENTLEDMSDCNNFLRSGGDPISELSVSEKRCAMKIIQMCALLAEDFKDEPVEVKP